MNRNMLYSQAPVEYRLNQLSRELDALREENLHLRDLLLDYEEKKGPRGMMYVGTVTKNLFHHPSCKWLQGIPKSKLLTWDSHEAAVRAGRKPCKTCRA